MASAEELCVEKLRMIVTVVNRSSEQSVLVGSHAFFWFNIRNVNSPNVQKNPSSKLSFHIG